MDQAEGWVLVFDLDQTITACDEDNNVEFNSKIVEILKKAVKDREKGIVSAIFLLTNNTDKIYIDKVHRLLIQRMNTATVFDFIVDGAHPVRSHMPEVRYIKNAKQKTVADVEFMLEQVNKTSKNLIHRLLFFDDQEHILALQLKSAGKSHHFIHINPPFVGTFEENQNLNQNQNKTMPRKRRKNIGTRKRIAS